MRIRLRPMTPPAGGKNFRPSCFPQKIGALASRNGGGDYAARTAGRNSPGLRSAPARSGGGISRFLAMTRNFALGTFGLALLIFRRGEDPSRLVHAEPHDRQLRRHRRSRRDQDQSRTTPRATPPPWRKRRPRRRRGRRSKSRSTASSSSGFPTRWECRSRHRTWPISAVTPPCCCAPSDTATTTQTPCPAHAVQAAAIRQTMAQEQATVGRNSRFRRNPSGLRAGRATVACPRHACSDRAAATAATILSRPPAHQLRAPKSAELGAAARPRARRMVKATLPEGFCEHRLSDRA